MDEELLVKLTKKTKSCWWSWREKDQELQAEADEEDEKLQAEADEDDEELQLKDDEKDEELQLKDDEKDEEIQVEVDELQPGTTTVGLCRPNCGTQEAGRGRPKWSEDAQGGLSTRWPHSEMDEGKEAKVNHHIRD